MNSKNTQCKNCGEWFHICSSCDISDVDSKSRAEGYCCVECLAKDHVDCSEKKLEILCIELLNTKDKNAILRDTLSNLYANFGCSDPPCRNIDPPKVIQRDYCEYHKLIAESLKKVS